MPCSEESGFSNCFFCRSTSENSGFWHFFGDVVLLSYPGQDARFGSCFLGSCFYAGERPGVSSGGLALHPFTCLLCLHLMFAFWPADRSPLWSSPSPAVDLDRPGPSVPPGSPARTSQGCTAVGPVSHCGPRIPHHWLQAQCILLPGWPCLQPWGPSALCHLPLLGHQVQASWPAPPSWSGLKTHNQSCRRPPRPLSPPACTVGKMVSILCLSGMEFPKRRGLLFSFEEQL